MMLRSHSIRLILQLIFLLPTWTLADSYFEYQHCDRSIVINRYVLSLWSTAQPRYIESLTASFRPTNDVLNFFRFFVFFCKNLTKKSINMSQDDLRLSHIKANFPLEGEYYFRFKCKYNTFTVWLDLDNDESKLPLYNSRLFVKATRISWNLNSKFFF